MAIRAPDGADKVYFPDILGIGLAWSGYVLPPTDWSGLVWSDLLLTGLVWSGPVPSSLVWSLVCTYFGPNLAIFWPKSYFLERE